jgi:hypothetical protein
VWQPEPLADQFRAEELPPRPWFSGGINILVGILGLEIVALIITKVLPIGEEPSAAVITIFMFVGFILIFVCHIWLVARIWEESPAWALGAIFIPVVCLIAVGKFPEKTKRSFVGQFISLAICLCTLPFAIDQLNKPKMYTDTKRHVKLEVPGNWTAQESQKIDALVVRSPESDSNGGALVIIEAAYGNVEEFRETRIEDYIERLNKTKANFVLKSSKTITHPSGLSTTELVYSYIGDDKTPITKKDILLVPQESKVVLAINAMARSSEWQQFEPKLNSVIDSVRPF